MKFLFATLTAILLTTAASTAELPEGYWPVERSQPILDATLGVSLQPDLGDLSAAESLALAELLEAGRIIQSLYEDQLHAQASEAFAALMQLHLDTGEGAATQNLLDLWYQSNGPIVTTLDNERLPFVPAAAADPGKTVYPAGLARAEIDGFLASHGTAAKPLLATRTIVRRAIAEYIATDLQRLDEYPEIDVLHDGLRQSLESLQADPAVLYAVPYALAYAPQLRKARRHLNTAAEIVADESPDFAAYLRNRGRDLLSGDYESGDASWVSGNFDGLNAQIGSYETYNDNLLGVKAFFGASILARDVAKSRALAAAMNEMQAIENSLPYDHQKDLRSDIPVGVYNVIADFGQARGANTATILPNNADHTRKYGRTILIRYNILTNPDMSASRKTRYDAVIDTAFRDHLTMDGGFERTLWHEVGHYLGVSKAADGRSLDEALADYSDLFEELKSDLVSLFSAPSLHSVGYHDDGALRAHYADGIRRTLQSVKPRPDQPYQNMQLIQFNFYLENGLLAADPESGRLTIDYDRYHEVVTQLLRRVLQVQYAGDYDLAMEFVERWNYWDDILHGRLAERMQDSGSFRRTAVRYGALSN